MLPNESFLVVLHFADYKTLVLAKLAGRRFLRLATTYAEELARHRRFRVTFHTSYISYSDVTIDERPKRIRYEPVNQASLAAACQEVADVIGPHAVSNLAFSGSTMIMDGVGAVFEAAPALKYAEDVDLYWPGDSTSVNNDPEAFMQNFAGMKTLSLSLGFDTFRQLSWSFLRKESARELRLIKVSGCGSAPPRPMDRSVEELVRCCVTLPHLQGGAPLELNGAPPFSKNKFTGPFGLQIIELLRSTAREVTFHMSTRQDDAELIRRTIGAHSDYAMDGDDYIIRYASDESGIVASVKGLVRAASYDPCSIAIRRTAEVPRKKARTSEEALPMTSSSKAIVTLYNFTDC